MARKKTPKPLKVSKKDADAVFKDIFGCAPLKKGEMRFCNASGGVSSVNLEEAAQQLEKMVRGFKF